MGESEKMTWAESELSGADWGDQRRNKRLVTIVEDLVAQPNESVPQARKMWAREKVRKEKSKVKSQKSKVYITNDFY